MKKDSLYSILATALLGWIGYATITFQAIGERLTKLESKAGIHAARVEHKDNVWADFEIYHVPETLVQKTVK